jgi:hypothetical protein
MKIKFFRSQLQTDSIPVTSDPKGTLAPVEVAYSFKKYGKAKIFGTNSAGAFDTGASCTYFFDNNIIIDIPSELHENALDKRSDYVGITPDYYVDFNKSNWISFVLSKL